MVKSVIIDSMNKNTPEYYGYKLGENIAPYINKCIDETGECFIAEGTHIVGRNDAEWNKGHVWSDSSIVWGWNKKNDIKIIGAGKDKTILKYVDNVNTRSLFGTDAPIVHMLTTNYDASCDNNLIEGITFDGNYENNHDISTVCCIRIRGANNIIRNCKFINFGPGDKSNHECFQVFVVPVNKGDKGSHVLNCEFTSVGNKKIVRLVIVQRIQWSQSEEEIQQLKIIYLKIARLTSLISKARFMRSRLAKVLALRYQKIYLKIIKAHVSMLIVGQTLEQL